MISGDYDLRSYWLYNILLYQIPDSSSDESEDSRARIGPPMISSPSSPPESDPEEDPEVPMDVVDGEILPAVPAPEMEIPPHMLPDYQQPAAVQDPLMVVPLRMQPVGGVPSEGSVTSRPHAGEPRTVPYRVYAELGRECDFLQGQIRELRQMVDSLTHTVREEVPPVVEREPMPDGRTRFQVIDRLVSQHLDGIASSSHRSQGSGGIERLLRWVMTEVRDIFRAGG